MNIFLYNRIGAGSAKLYLALLVLVIVIIGSVAGVRQAQAESAYTATVSASSLIIRETPERKGNPLGSLPKGTQINVLREDEFGWAEIEHQSQKGWVAAYYLIKSADNTMPSSEAGNQAEGNEPRPADPPDSQNNGEPEAPPADDPSNDNEAAADLQSKAGIVSANGLRLRQEPNLEAKIITLLAESTVVKVNNEAGDWLQVTTPEGQDGWVAKQYIALEGQKAEATDSQSDIPAEPRSTSLRGKRIVIDPGHGGKDSGTTGVKLGTPEKTINLSLSLLLADKLRSHGAEVYLTREEDVFIELADRVSKAQQTNADLFVSIHHNSGKSTSSGIISFYHSQTKDKPLASVLQHELILSTGMVDGGSRYGNYAVLRGNPAPAILLELGFLSNPLEEEKIISAEYQNTVADAITAGIQSYFQ
ncbi:N-acetylmuramoyl-L-alanine amidase [Paenibacillus senegalensis]|uniref:N-acetylmuramoyl-L-alanine amidase n=1 Tax=Paenibacillus senegalensis TaxID=1465766 RepID=UPI00028A137C|nr:N-acetylmuramoyl-L-alanine amidase [Paenibacillus senegalensis]